MKTRQKMKDLAKKFRDGLEKKYAKTKEDEYKLFIALPLPEYLRKQLRKQAEKIKTTVHGNIKIVEEQNLHITVLFLGIVKKEKLEELEKKLDTIKKTGEIKVTIEGLGYFPNKDYVKVIWSKVESEGEKIKKLQQKILTALDLKPQKEFTPHITLGRVKQIENKDTLKYLQQQTLAKEEKINITEVILYKSTLTHEGPKYEKLYSLPL